VYDQKYIINSPLLEIRDPLVVPGDLGGSALPGPGVLSADQQMVPF
jgi:hypothetical protein